MAGQEWQKTDRLGKIEISTVTAGTPKRPFGTGINGAVSAGTVDRQVVWIHNCDASSDIWYTIQASSAVLPAALLVTTKHGRILPGASEPFTIDETLDVIIDASAGTIAYTAREEL